MSRPEILIALRASTRAVHGRLDQSPRLSTLLSPSVTLPQYADALASLAPIQQAAEDLLVNAGWGWPVAERAPALLADLQTLGAPSEPLCAQLPARPATLAQALGLSYVLEASRLGESVIANHLARRLPHAPRRFFAACADAGAWPRYVAWVASLGKQNALAQQQACDAALALFQAFMQQVNAHHAEAMA